MGTAAAAAAAAATAAAAAAAAAERGHPVVVPPPCTARARLYSWAEARSLHPRRPLTFLPLTSVSECSSVIKASKFGPFPESLVAVYIQQVLQVGAASGRGRMGSCCLHVCYGLQVLQVGAASGRVE